MLNTLNSDMVLASSEVDPMLETQMMHNRAYDIQQMYMRDLQDNYTSEKTIIQAKKFKI